jgi:signal transduction histidine kinase
MQAASEDILARIKRSPFVFPFALLVGLVLMLITETAYQQATGSLDRLGRINEARTSIQTLLRRTVDAESGQRGYLLTGRAEYLEPYRNALDDIDESLAWLREYYRADPALAQAMERTDDLVRAKLSELSTVLGLYDEGRHDAWRELILLDFGREKMAQVRSAAEQLLALESNKVLAGRKAVYNTLLLHRIGVAAMSAISLLALFMYLRQTRALEVQLLRQQAAVQAERDQLEAEVRRRTEQLIELAHHLQTAREDERSRLARELHDELGSLLTAAKLDAARIKSRLAGAAPEALERLAHLSETLNSGIALKRRIIEDLRPSTLDNFGLVAALEILTREFAERSGIQLVCTLQPVKLKPADELTAFRLVQEALTNVAKHAHASRVEVSLARMDSRVELSVHDNGIGFDLQQHPTSAHGLLGMRYRVEAAGGVLRLTSAPGQGTHIAADLPLA